MISLELMVVALCLYFPISGVRGYYGSTINILPSFFSEGELSALGPPFFGPMLKHMSFFMKSFTYTLKNNNKYIKIVFFSSQRIFKFILRSMENSVLCVQC